MEEETNRDNHCLENQNDRRLGREEQSTSWKRGTIDGHGETNDR